LERLILYTNDAAAKPLAFNFMIGFSSPERYYIIMKKFYSFINP